MMVLPIFEREMLVRARNRSTYWTRCGLAALALLTALPPLSWSGPMTNSADVGRACFHAIISAGFVLSCAACLLTSESISAERREGTLGLLLLTRVRHFDVLLGKLASNGLSGLFALVALLPVLMIPVLAGGVTGSEVFRHGLVLLESLFLALSAGLWISARDLVRLRSAQAALLLEFGLVCVPVLVGLIPQLSAFGLISPLGTALAAGDSAYRIAPARYWLSLVCVQALAWSFIFGSVFRLRFFETSAQDGTCPSETRRLGLLPGVFSAMRNHLPFVRPKPACLLSNASSPLGWLLQRQRGAVAMLWAATVLTCLQYTFYMFIGRLAGATGFVAVSWSLGLTISAITGAIYAWVASRFFISSRRTGELELLLTTPLCTQDIVSAQWQAFKTLARWPVLVSLLPTLVQWLFFFTRGFFRSQDQWWMLAYGISLLGSIIGTVVGVGALGWVGLWFGLRAPGQTRAIVWTVGLARGLPFVVSLIWSMFSSLILRKLPMPSPSIVLVFAVPELLDILLCIGLIRFARNKLRHQLTTGEPFDLRQAVSGWLASVRAAVRGARAWTPPN